MTLNTYGLKPMTWWKLFEIEGWQVLVSVEESEQEEGRFGVRVSAAIADLEEVTSITMSATSEAWAKDVFEGIDDGPKALQMFLDQVGPMLNKMGVGA